MISKISLAALATTAVMAFATFPGSAASIAPLSLLKDAAAPSMVEKTHGWHRTCRKGFTDVHKHVKGVGRITCKTRRCTIDLFGNKECTWS